MRITVYLEDHGQDFLEWDIEDGVVVGCRPLQGWVWNGTIVHNENIKRGDILVTTAPSGHRDSRMNLRYPVERVKRVSEKRQPELVHQEGG